MNPGILRFTQDDAGKCHSERKRRVSGRTLLTMLCSSPRLLVGFENERFIQISEDQPMAAGDWDLLFWRQASDLLQQAERIHKNFLQLAAGANYRSFQRRSASWAPPVNVVETDESLWVMSAIPGVAADRVDVRLDGRELVISGERPLPACCRDGELKIWEIPLGRFERRLVVIEGRNPLSVGDVSLQNGLLIIELRKGS
jgi:HSP20 family protein